MIVTRIKNPWINFDLCWLIRLRKIRATPEAYTVAKNVTFARAYGATMLDVLKMSERSKW